MSSATTTTQDNTKQMILDVAQDLLRERGANGISYTDISDLVKIRKASIHHHFPTKQSLIKEIMRVHGEEFFEKLVTTTSAKRGIDALSAYLGLFQQSFAEGKGGFICLFGMLGAEINSLDRSVAAEVRAFFARNLTELAEIIERGVNDNTIRSFGPPRDLARVIFSSVEGAMIIARADKGVRSFSPVTTHILRMVAAVPVN